MKMGDFDDYKMGYIDHILYYFREFLETDFKKASLPKRRIVDCISKKKVQYRLLIRSDNYNNLYSELLQFIKSLFEEDEKTSKRETFIIKSKNDYDFIDTKLDFIVDIFKNAEFNLIELPLLLEKIKNAIPQETIAQELEIELPQETEKELREYIDILYEPFFLQINKNDADFIEKRKENLQDLLYDLIIDSAIKPRIKITSTLIRKQILDSLEQDKLDLFSTLFELRKSGNVLFKDKSNYYLYFYDIKINGNIFPLFYIPIEIDYLDKEIKITPHSQIFINKKAVTYFLESKKLKSPFIKSRMFKISNDELEEINKLYREILKEINRIEIDVINFNEKQKIHFNNGYISNNIYIVVADGNDESIIGDYEDILHNNPRLKENLKEIIKSYLCNKENNNINEKVEKEYDKYIFSKKIIQYCPVNLSKEQQQILIALRKDSVKTLIIEGPPGTGKSHTIVSIISDYILKNKNVLILSDKEEALQVVEDKINEILNCCKKGESAKQIINPILRIGKNSNFSKIIKKNNIDFISNDLYELKNIFEVDDSKNLYDKSVDEYNKYMDFIKKMEEYSKTYINKLNEEIELKELIAQTTGEIEQTKDNYEKLFEELNNDIELRKNIINSEKIEKSNELKLQIENTNIKTQDAINNLEKLLKSKKEEIAIKKVELLKQDEIKNDLESLNLKNKINDLRELQNKHEFFIDLFTKICNDDYVAFIKLCKKIDSYNIGNNIILQKINENNFEKISAYVNYYNTCSFLKKIFKNSELKHYKIFFQNEFGINGLKYKEIINKTKSVIDQLATYCITNNIDKSFMYKIINYITVNDVNINGIKYLDEKDINIFKDIKKSLSFMEININFNIKNIEDMIIELKDLDKKIKEYVNLESEFNNYEKDIQQQLKDLNKKREDGINNLESEFNYKLIEKQKQWIEKQYTDNAETLKELEDKFKKFEHLPISLCRNKIEDAIKLKLYATVLRQVKDIYYKLKNTSRTRVMQNAIKGKMSLETFSLIKEYFPCIIASLRDYANIIPLEKEIFDLIIIDEASQVSIAQAFPSLIRGKKIIIFGDRNQFSNVKSSMANIQKSQEYLDKIRNSSRDEKDEIREKLKIFDIKNSVLDFIEENKPDFNIKLNTHFRGYAELISFSNKYFYSNTLQTLKIRKKMLSEIIKFEILPININILLDDGNMCYAEAEFIVAKIKEMQEKEEYSSVGIITPFTDQVKCLLDLIQKKLNIDYCNKIKLKVMTFDSCQGEERDIIFYSMVATKEQDKLNYIFPKNIVQLDDENDKKIRLQRLNVGFSRVKECAYFVLSKPIEEFEGGIGVAIKHFKGQLDKQDTFLEITDKKSPMEEKIKEYILNTDFYLQNQKDILLKCQFPIGEYLKQVDRNYYHPLYIVDFLLSYKKFNIIVEYDGFDYHFDEDTNKYNYIFHYKEEDIIRQNILESYGYKFIRLNKFNLDRENQVKYIDKLIKENLG
jgi:very-short-patch-repair endonuclease